MLRVFSKTAQLLEDVDIESAIDSEALWYDLLAPEPQEIRHLERALNIELPTVEEMEEIEASSRLYEADGSLYMTAIIISTASAEGPTASPVTFILHPQHLITMRYFDPKPFQSYERKLTKRPATAEKLFMGLLESIVDRIADLLEMVRYDIDEISSQIFQRKKAGARSQNELHEALIRIGQKGDFATKIRESLENFNRLLKFLQIQEIDSKEQIHMLRTDVRSISDHLTFLFSKINFLLDASLGLVNIEQNAIIKIFSVAAVVFLPPTLIASIYGMNFRLMPELSWPLGYPMALVLMMISAILPFAYFKRKGWL